MITRSGVNSSAIAIIARCRMPPDSWCGKLRRCAWSMPTIRRTSADLAPISSRDVFPCARIASLNCAPIDLTGLSAFIALCMTTDMSRQRTDDSWPSVSPTRLLPLKVTLPAGDAGRRRQQLGDGEQQGGLPAAGLADDAEELAPVEGEGHVVDRPDVGPVEDVVDGQPADLKQHGAPPVRPVAVGPAAV